MKSEDYALLGLEARDIRIYEALWHLERASLRSIAKETGINRGTVYETIKKLTANGLVSFTQAGARRQYAAACPEVFLGLISDRRDQLRRLELQATDYVRKLQAGAPRADGSYFAQFYEGDEGIAAILRDVLQTMLAQEDKAYYVLSSKNVSAFIYTNFPNFSRRRQEGGISVRVISDHPGTERLVLAERKQLLAGSAPLNGYTIIYGNKVALISLSGTNVLSGIVITDPGIANMQRLIFSGLWSTTV